MKSAYGTYSSLLIFIKLRGKTKKVLGTSYNSLLSYAPLLRHALRFCARSAALTYNSLLSYACNRGYRVDEEAEQYLTILC